MTHAETIRRYVATRYDCGSWRAVRVVVRRERRAVRRPVRHVRVEGRAVPVVWEVSVAWRWTVYVQRPGRRARERIDSGAYASRRRALARVAHRCQLAMEAHP